MATGHQSPQSNLPPLAYKIINTTTWGSGGNTCTITDQYARSNSFIEVNVTGTTPPAGLWCINIAAGGGSFTITSSNSESSTLPISYIII